MKPFIWRHGLLFDLNNFKSGLVRHTFLSCNVLVVTHPGLLISQRYQKTCRPFLWARFSLWTTRCPVLLKQVYLVGGIEMKMSRCCLPGLQQGFRHSLPWYPPREAEEVWAGWVVGEVDWELAEWENSEGCHQRLWV